MRPLVSCVLALLVWGASVPVPAGAGSLPQSLPPLLPGEVVTLLDPRPELWVADDGGVLHFAGDTRALAGRRVDWSYRLQVSLDQLRGLPLGDPWLSTALVAAGGTIFQPRWDTGANAPTLYQVQDVADLTRFGIDEGNYDAFVLPQAEWERRTGFLLRDLPRQLLPPIAPRPAPPAPVPPPAPTPTPAAPAATPAPAPAIPAPATTPIPAGTATGSAGAPSGSVLTAFAPPTGRDWIDVTADTGTIVRLIPSGTLQGERTLRIWRRAVAGGPYAYLQVSAIDLAPHPDVRSLDDLARLKLRFLRNDSDAFQAGDPRPATVAGQPALVTDTTATRRFPGGESTRGGVSGADLDRFVTQRSPGGQVGELIWSGRLVLTIRGQRAYAFRLDSTGPGVKNDHLGDLDALLAGLVFSD